MHIICIIFAYYLYNICILFVYYSYITCILFVYHLYYFKVQYRLGLVDSEGALTGQPGTQWIQVTTLLFNGIDNLTLTIWFWHWQFDFGQSNGQPGTQWIQVTSLLFNDIVLALSSWLWSVKVSCMSMTFSYICPDAFFESFGQYQCHPKPTTWFSGW